MLSPFSTSQLLPAPTLAEQVVAVELAYYRQLDHCVVTEADWTSWYRKQVLLPAEQALPINFPFPAFARHVLERHHRPLHSYMARQLSAEAWAHWLRHGGLVASIW